ncbi:K+-transporting ATPase ATPase C chain [Phycicoccus badiiscoriae]|uniref:Potassium-transporting ATPase KdpC subunit n=1 Tax=Pedococcus badiiscoriae TaxID=642776 RepID=A0A852WCZ2_9MICO|nr:K(+)-transporting ATPase subunit C [Pedococcus badiiscoriae]NYG06560.1 K+-transporting ATPase ATPase C chain [Pedococcus badiiscoriae]
MTSSLRNLVASLRMLGVLTLLLGVVYPAVVWGIGRVAFPAQADGSLVRRHGVVVGSSLLGQQVTDPRFFHGRPSAPGYAAGVSGGSNLAGTSADQVKAVRERSTAYGATSFGAVPADALTASGSGLDPHISPDNARAQASRVAAANGLDLAAMLRLVDAHTQGRSLGFLGEPRVDVLELNLAVQAAAGR